MVWGLVYFQGIEEGRKVKRLGVEGYNFIGGIAGIIGIKSYEKEPISVYLKVPVSSVIQLFG